MPTWGDGNTDNSEVRSGERALECAVSHVIGKMPFLWLLIEDEAGPESRRGFIERNSISLLRQYAEIYRAKMWLGQGEQDRRLVASLLNRVTFEMQRDLFYRILAARDR